MYEKCEAVLVAEPETPDHDELQASDDDRGNEKLHNLTQKSCNVIVCKFLKVPLPKNLQFKSHLKPLVKELKLKTRGKDKNRLITDIIKELVPSNHVKCQDRC